MTPRRPVEAAFLLPVLGAVLLLPPVILIVAGASRDLGLPLFVPYLFVVWILLIAATRSSSRRLQRLEEAEARILGDDAAGRDLTG